MSSPAREVVIEQALYGYRGGHQLLASSTQLSTDEARTAVLMSDLSGSSSVSGFDSYLMGYRLSGSKYALTRTWLASEMPRPGSVWTQALLISIDDLAALDDLTMLDTLFRRPTMTGSFERYQESITVRSDVLLPDSNPTVVSDLEALIAALYGAEYSSKRPVLIAASSSSGYDSALLSLWSQQWPRLRQEFSFSTGVLGPLPSFETLFDVAVIPASRLSTIERHAGDSAVRVDQVDERAEWIRTIASDLSARRGDSLKSFVWRFSSDVGANRSAFGALARVKVALGLAPRGDGSMSNLLEGLAAAFPTAPEARNLKMAIAGPESAGEETLGSAGDEFTTLGALVTADVGLAFDVEELRVRSRAVEFWRSDPDAAGELMLRLSSRAPTLLSDSFLDGSADAIQPDRAAALFEKDVALVDDFIARSPRLAAARELWASSDDVALAIGETVIRLDLGREQYREIFKAGLAEGRSGLMNVMMTDSNSVLAMLDVVDGGWPQGTELEPSLAMSLAEHSSDIVAWLAAYRAADARTPFLLIQALDPGSPVVQAQGTEFWRRQLAGARDGDAASWMYGQFFLLALAFGDPPGNPASLAGSVYQRVASAARSNQTPDRTWYALGSTLLSAEVDRGGPIPSPSERATSLRRTLIEKFVGHHWPIGDLLSCFNDAVDLHAALRVARSIPGGERFLSAAAADSDLSGAQARWQIGVLRDFSRRRSRMRRLLDSLLRPRAPIEPAASLTVGAPELAMTLNELRVEWSQTLDGLVDMWPLFKARVGIAESGLAGRQDDSTVPVVEVNGGGAGDRVEILRGISNGLVLSEAARTAALSIPQLERVLRILAMKEAGSSDELSTIKDRALARELESLVGPAQALFEAMDAELEAARGESSEAGDLSLAARLFAVAERTSRKSKRRPPTRRSRKPRRQS